MKRLFVMSIVVSMIAAGVLVSLSAAIAEEAKASERSIQDKLESLYSTESFRYNSLF